MTRPFDPPAPEGYEVHDQGSKPDCAPCVAGRDGAYCTTLPPCSKWTRPDGRWVYFVRAVPKDAK